MKRNRFMHGSTYSTRVKLLLTTQWAVLELFEKEMGPESKAFIPSVDEETADLETTFGIMDGGEEE